MGLQPNGSTPAGQSPAVDLNYAPLLLFLQKKNRSMLAARVEPLRSPASEDRDHLPPGMVIRTKHAYRPLGDNDQGLGRLICWD